MYAYVCIYIYIYMCIYNLCVCVCVCVCACVCVCVCVCVLQVGGSDGLSPIGHHWDRTSSDTEEEDDSASEASGEDSSDSPLPVLTLLCFTSTIVPMLTRHSASGRGRPQQRRQQRQEHQEQQTHLWRGLGGSSGFARLAQERQVPQLAIQQPGC